jgi:hypothetical protein
MEHALEFWNMSHHRLAYQLLHKSMHSRHDHPDISYAPPHWGGVPHKWFGASGTRAVNARTGCQSQGLLHPREKEQKPTLAYMG